MGNHSHLIETVERRSLLSAAPFLGSPVIAGQTIEAENFDTGGEGVAYHVTQHVSPKSSYRPQDAVAVQPGGSNGYDVGYTTAGEWLQYTIQVPSTGNYYFQASVANLATGAKFHAAVDGITVASLSVPNTGGWQTYQTVSSGSFLLGSGVHTLRVYLDQAATNGTLGNFDWFKFVAGTAAPSFDVTWHSVAPIPQGMTEGEGEVVNGKLYVFSGFTTTAYYPSSRVYCYDPTANAWTRLADMPVPVTHTGTCVDGNYIYLAGGYPPNAAHTYQIFATTNVWRFDTVSDTWTALPGLPQARGGGQLAIVNNTLHYFGGDDLTRAYERVEHWSLDLSNLSAGWTARAALPTGRNRLGAVTLNGKIYAIGGAIGQDVKEVAQSIVEVYDPTSDTWSTIANMPTPRALIMSGCFVYDGQIIVAGGETSFDVPTNQVTAYDPTTNTWRQLNHLPAPRIGGICRLIDGMFIYTCGHPGFNTNTWIGTIG